MKSPAEWVEVFREEAHRVQQQSGAAGGRCWVAHDGILGVSLSKYGYAHLRVTWPGDDRSVTDVAHRVTLAAVVNESLPLRHGLDGGTISVHHLCRVKACVRPDHLEPVDGILNGAEAAARTSVLKSTQHLVGELEAELHHETKRRRSLLRDLGRVRDERDAAVGLLEKLGNRVLELDAELGRARDESARLYERLEKRR